ncbi:MAG: two pore domain potassium channel family protein [Neptuniibacter sp.]
MYYFYKRAPDLFSTVVLALMDYLVKFFVFCSLLLCLEMLVIFLFTPEEGNRLLSAFVFTSYVLPLTVLSVYINHRFIFVIYHNLASTNKDESLFPHYMKKLQSIKKDYEPMPIGESIRPSSVIVIALFYVTLGLPAIYEACDTFAQLMFGVVFNMKDFFSGLFTSQEGFSRFWGMSIVIILAILLAGIFFKVANAIFKIFFIFLLNKLKFSDRVSSLNNLNEMLGFKFFFLFLPYVVMGVIFAGIWCLIYMIDHSSINSFNEDNAITVFEAVYFSFVTMTTLGYGEVTPNSWLAKWVVIWQSAYGIFYMAVVVGLSIGYSLSLAKFATEKSKPSNEPFYKRCIKKVR